MPIRDTIGQYVRGFWDVQTDQIDTTDPHAIVSVTQVWKEDTTWQQLVWREDGVNFTLTTHGTVESGNATSCALDQDDFAAVAQSLQPVADAK